MELAQARYRVNQTMDFFVEAFSGARRLPDEPGADGAGGGKPGSDRSREGG